MQKSFHSGQDSKTVTKVQLFDFSIAMLNFHSTIYEHTPTI